MKFKNLAKNIICDICNHSLDNFFNGVFSYEKIESSVHTCHCNRNASVNVFDIDNISTGIFLVEENEYYYQLLIIKNKSFIIEFSFSPGMEFCGIENFNYKGTIYPEHFYKFDNKKELSGEEITKLIPVIRKDLICYNNNLLFE